MSCPYCTAMIETLRAYQHHTISVDVTPDNGGGADWEWQERENNYGPQWFDSIECLDCGEELALGVSEERVLELAQMFCNEDLQDVCEECGEDRDTYLYLGQFTPSIGCTKCNALLFAPKVPQ